MTLVAAKHLYNPRQYGHVAPGEVFSVDDRAGRDLCARGCARQLTYETKVITAGPPPAYEVKEGTAAKPFRHLPVIDPEPPALAAVRVAVRAVSDVPPARDSGSVERGKRRGSAAGK